MGEEQSPAREGPQGEWRNVSVGTSRIVLVNV